GAALIDTNGDVVAVMVEQGQGQNLNFVVPSDYVTNLLQGRLLELQLNQAYKSGGSIELKVETRIANPTKRFDGLSLEIWTAPAPASGDANKVKSVIRPASNVRPIPLPGDGP